MVKKMKFSNERAQPSSITDEVAGEHERQLLTIAEARIRQQHQHPDGSPVQIREVGMSDAFPSIETKLTGTQDIQALQQQAIPKEQVRYDRKFQAPGAPVTYTGTQSFNAGSFSGQSQDALMIGCNCGAEWTVTGKILKQDGQDSQGGVTIQRYGSSGNNPGYTVSSGAGGERIQYSASNGQRQEHKG